MLLELHKHNSDCQVEQEERADDDAQDEIDLDEPRSVDILENVHDLGPTFHCDALENGKECGADVVK